MSGTFGTNPVDGTYALTHDLKVRALDGNLVQLSQYSVVRVLQTPSLHGWSILTDTNNKYAPVRDEDVGLIVARVPQGVSPVFPQAPVADSTTLDTIEVELAYMTLREDSVVCDSRGYALSLAAHSKVSIFARGPNTFTWFRTIDGQVFVVDSRNRLEMDLVTEEENETSAASENTAIVLPPRDPPVEPNGPNLLARGTTVAQATEPGPETIKKIDVRVVPPLNGRNETVGRAGKATPQSVLPREPSTEQLEPTVDNSNKGNVEEMPKASHAEADATLVATTLREQITYDPEPLYARSEAENAYLARIINASLDNFSGTDADFCNECFAFKIDHAAQCSLRVLFE